MNIFDQLIVLWLWCVSASSPLRLWDSPKSWNGGLDIYQFCVGIYKNHPTVWQLLSIAVLFTFVSRPLFYSFPLGIKEKASRGEKFNSLSFWPYSWSAALPPGRATWYHERILVYHKCNCFTAVRLLTQIRNHLATFQWSVPSASAKGWLKKGIGSDGGN